jgi:hypothetical protein
MMRLCAAGWDATTACEEIPLDESGAEKVVEGRTPKALAGHLVDTAKAMRQAARQVSDLGREIEDRGLEGAA